MNLRRKRRTRGHIVADLAINFVERQFLLAGHALFQIDSDYGIDLCVCTFDAAGELENGFVSLQVKGTDNIKFVEGGAAVSYQFEIAHLNHWVSEPMPVIVVVYDAAAERAYWAHIQSHFEDLAGFISPKLANYKTIRISTRNVLDRDSVGTIQKLERNGVLW